MIEETLGRGIGTSNLLQDGKERSAVSGPCGNIPSRWDLPRVVLEYPS